MVAPFALVLSLFFHYPKTAAFLTPPRDATLSFPHANCGSNRDYHPAALPRSTITASDPWFDYAVRQRGRRVTTTCERHVLWCTSAAAQRPPPVVSPQHHKPHTHAELRTTRRGCPFDKPTTDNSNTRLMMTMKKEAREPLLLLQKSSSSSSSSTTASSSSVDDTTNLASTSSTTTPDDDAIVGWSREPNDDDDPQRQQEQQRSRNNGLVVLLTVPLAWGTYGPVVRYLSTNLDPSIPGLVFSAAYYTVAAVTLWSLVLLSSSSSKTTKWTMSSSSSSDKMMSGDASSSSSSWTNSMGSLASWPQAMTSSSSLVLTQGGLELGGYLFLGNVLQVMALRTVPADRAGFLVQLTTIIVPILDAYLLFRIDKNNNDADQKNQRNMSARTWIACWIALAGVVCLELNHDATMTAAAAAAAVIQPRGEGIASVIMVGATAGDALMVGAALFYSLHVVRLSNYAAQTAPLELAAAKATVETVLSIGLVAALLLWQGSSTVPALADAAADIQGFVHSIAVSTADGSTTTGASSWLVDNDGPSSVVVQVVGAVLWTGWVTCAYTIYAQSYGQRRVPPTDANLIYTVQPLFTAFFAWALLGETTTMGSTSGMVGGLLILAAVYLVGSAPAPATASSSPDDDVVVVTASSSSSSSSTRSSS